MNAAGPAPSTEELRVLRWPAVMLGVALGGFFDGILLHQILQWHHLLSDVEAARDLRTQLLADGVFHALMYLIAVWAALALWRRRGAWAQRAAGRWVGAHALMGFGAWHVVDALLSHWITGIHRIRGEAANPLAWDLGWFLVFGLLPLGLGWWTRRRRDGGGAGGRGAALSLLLAAALAGPIAALPSAEGDQVLVLFAPGVAPGAAHQALARADARMVWVDRSGGLWAVHLPDRRARWSLYGRGALFVGGSALGLGCLTWSRPAPAAGPRVGA